MTETASEYRLEKMAKRHQAAIAHARVAPIQFLIAWKQGVEMAGPEFFVARRGYDTPDSVANATNRWQLIPDCDRIEQSIGPKSTSERIFLAALCTFYNGEWGQSLLDKHGDGCTSIGDVANRLDPDQVVIITALMTYHTGW